MDCLGLRRSRFIVGVIVAGILLVLLAGVAVRHARAQKEFPQAQIQGLLNTTLWQGSPTPLGVYPSAMSPRILFAPTGAIHVIWESEGRLYHAWRSVEGTWHGPTPIYWGMSPSLAIDASGRVHMVFVQNVVGNLEVYYTVFDGYRWSLPRNVSHTPTPSYSPYISIRPDGTPEVVWNEKVGTRDVIYHAALDGATWVDFPIPSAWGKAPILHITSRIAHVLWQGPDRTSAYDIYHVQGIEGSWQLPQNLSDTPGKQSVDVKSVIDGNNWIHAVWLEEGKQGYQVAYTFGNGVGWRWPLLLSGEGAKDVTIASSERGTYVHVGWSDNKAWWTRWRAITSPEWSAPLQLAHIGEQALTFRFAPQNDTRLRALWRLDTDRGAEMWYGEANTPVVQRLYFALIGQRVTISGHASR